MNGLNMILLLSCWIIAGIAAKAPSKPVLHYRVKNSTLCLQVGKSPPYKDVRWNFDDNFIVYDKNVTPNYKGKVDYNKTDGSLCINNLNETNSGIYKVSITHNNFVQSEELHELIIQEAVPRPVIRMSVIHSNMSAGLCNITVNCSIQDDWVWSVCDEDSCTTSQRSFRKVNAIAITVSAENRSIVCSGNNNVSTSSVSEVIEGRCFIKSNPEQEEKLQTNFFKIIVIVLILVCVFICAFIVCVAKRHLSTQSSHDQTQTSSAQFMGNQSVDAQPQSVPRASTSSSSEAEASYENVDTTQLNQTNSPTMSPREMKVDTVYSFLTGPDLTASVGKGDSSKDAKGHMKMSTAQSVTLGEAGQPAQIDTVYSVLQKPKNMKSQL